MKLCAFGKTLTAKSFLLMSLSLLSINTEAAPKIIYKDIYNKHAAWNTAPIPQSIRTVINNIETANPDLYQIVIYKMKDHYLLYQLSGTEWKAKKTKVRIGKKGNVIITEPEPTDQDDLNKASEAEAPPQCPDESVQFVVISAYPGIGAVDKAIGIVSDAAKQKFKTMTILSEEADGKTYKNWLACSNLKGFYSIGHGSPNAIMVGKGDVIDYQFFEHPNFVNKLKTTTVILNTCQVYNYPFGTEIMYGNAVKASKYDKNPGPNAYEFMGGHTNLLMEKSELTSACFMAQAILGAKMDYDTLKLCVGKQDFNYRNFGLSQPGKYLDNPPAISA